MNLLPVILDFLTSAFNFSKDVARDSIKFVKEKRPLFQFFAILTGLAFVFLMIQSIADFYRRQSTQCWDAQTLVSDGSRLVALHELPFRAGGLAREQAARTNYCIRVATYEPYDGTYEIVLQEKTGDRKQEIDIKVVMVRLFTITIPWSVIDETEFSREFSEVSNLLNPKAVDNIKQRCDDGFVNKFEISYRNDFGDKNTLIANNVIYEIECRVGAEDLSFEVYSSSGNIVPGSQFGQD